MTIINKFFLLQNKMYIVDKQGNARRVENVETYQPIKTEPAPSAIREKDLTKIRDYLRLKMAPQKSFIQRYGLIIILILLVLVALGCWLWMSKKNEIKKVEEPKFGLYF